MSCVFLVLMVSLLVFGGSKVRRQEMGEEKKKQVQMLGTNWRVVTRNLEPEDENILDEEAFFDHV